VEQNRSSYLLQINRHIYFFKNDKASPILDWQDCKCKIPTGFSDTVVIGVKVDKIK